MKEIQIRLWIRKRLTTIIVMLFALLSCEKNGQDPVEEQGIPILFTQTQIPTKADSGKQSNLTTDQTVGVLAYYLHFEGNEDAVWNDGAIPNFMYDQKMEATEGGQLTYSPTKYWPGNEKDRVKFFAYSPHSSTANGNTIILSSSNTSGYPTLYYAPNNTDNSKQADLLVAVTEPLNSGGVKLNFKHALTQLSFSAQCTNNLLNQVITITRIKLSNVANGNGQFTETGFQWTASTTTQDYTLSISQPITEGTFTDLSTTLYLVPQTSTCQLEIELMVAGIRKKTPQREISTADWAQGKKINYQLTINLNDLITQ